MRALATAPVTLASVRGCASADNPRLDARIRSIAASGTRADKVVFLDRSGFLPTADRSLFAATIRLLLVNLLLLLEGHVLVHLAQRLDLLCRSLCRRQVQKLGKLHRLALRSLLLEVLELCERVVADGIDTVAAVLLLVLLDEAATDDAGLERLLSFDLSALAHLLEDCLRQNWWFLDALNGHVGAGGSLGDHLRDRVRELGELLLRGERDACASANLDGLGGNLRRGLRLRRRTALFLAVLLRLELLELVLCQRESL